MLHCAVMRVAVMWSVLSSFDAGRSFVNAQPTVGAVIITPPLDRREGGEVQMRCVATNLEPNHIVEWKTGNTTLRWGDTTITPMQKYEYKTTQIDGMVIQELNIDALQKSDADEYVCNVNDPIPTGGSNIVASDNVTLSVLDSDFQFPNDSFPMCFPSGPTTVVTGSELSLFCLSDGNTSTVMMEIARSPPASSSLIRTPSTTIDSQTLMLTLTVDDTLDGVSFQCIISLVPYPEIMRSCTIGPFTTPPTTTPSFESSSTTPSFESSSTTPSFESSPTTLPLLETSPSSSSIVVGAAAGGAAAAVLVLIVILLLVCWKRGVICNGDSKKPDNPVGNANSRSDKHADSTNLYSSETSQATATVTYATPRKIPTNPVFDGDQTNDPPSPMPPPSPPKPVRVRSPLVGDVSKPSKPEPFMPKPQMTVATAGRPQNGQTLGEVAYASIDLHEMGPDTQGDWQPPESPQAIGYADVNFQQVEAPPDYNLLYATVNKRKKTDQP